MKKNFDLSNIKNYNRKFKKDLSFYTKEYLLLMKEIVEYLEKFIEHGNTKKQYIILKGIESINHIFLIILLYTKNLSLTLYHCKKSFLYYIEFISQIGEEGNSYLQLNSKDAILFIYRKSIFDINNEARQVFEIEEDDEIKMDSLRNLAYMFKDFYFLLVNNIVYKKENDVNNLNSEIVKIVELLNKKKLTNEEFYEKIKYLINYFTINNVTNNNFILNVIKSLLRRKKFTTIKKGVIEKRFTKENLQIYVNSNNIKGFVNFLVNKQ
jgi:hypothetical protein